MIIRHNVAACAMTRPNGCMALVDGRPGSSGSPQGFRLSCRECYYGCHLYGRPSVLWGSCVHIWLSVRTVACPCGLPMTDSRPVRAWLYRLYVRPLAGLQSATKTFGMCFPNVSQSESEVSWIRRPSYSACGILLRSNCIGQSEFLYGNSKMVHNFDHLPCNLLCAL